MILWAEQFTEPHTPDSEEVKQCQRVRSIAKSTHAPITQIWAQQLIRALIAQVNLARGRWTRK